MDIDTILIMMIISKNLINYKKNIILIYSFFLIRILENIEKIF